MDRILDLLIQLAEKDGVLPIENKVWERKLDEYWIIKLNGYDEPKDNIPPYYLYIEYNGFPAGLITPVSGSILA